MADRRGSAQAEHALREEFTQLRADIDSLIDTIGRMADGTASSLYADAKRRAGDLGRHAESVYDEAKLRGRETLETAESAVRANPLLSLAVAAGLGWLIGRVIRSR